MSKRIYVAYPLSLEFLEKLYPVYPGHLEQISLSFLKNMKFLSLLKLLRTELEMRVVLEGEESKNLYDIFLLIFLFTKSKNITFIHNDMSVVSLKRKEAVISFFKNVIGIFFGGYEALKIYCMSKMIGSKSSQPVEFQKKKILYLKTNFWFGIKAGGSVAHVEGIVKGFNKHGYSLDYVAIDKPQTLSHYIGHFFSLSLPKFLSFVFSLNLYLFDSIVYNKIKKIYYKDYGFIYHRMALNSLAGVLLSKKFKVPLVLEYNGSEVWVQRNWGKPLFLEKISQTIEDANLRWADYIVTISKVLQDELIARGVPEQKIIFYPNGVDPENFNSENYSKEQLLMKRQKLGLEKDDIVLTFIGTFGKWHGVEILAKTIQALYEDKPEWIKNNRVKFLLVGDGACMAEVKEILSSIPCYQDFVIITGLIPQDEAPHYLALSDILLSPHSPPNTGDKFFGSPTKLFEYMAMKKIIIASNLEQIGEVLSPAVHIEKIKEINESLLAILCTPGSVDNLKDAIYYSVENLSSLTFLGENASQKVLKNYTWEKHVDEILQKITSFSVDESRLS